MHSQWTLQDAKNKFSAVVNAACAGTPQVVTRRGKPAAVVLSMHDYEDFCFPCLLPQKRKKPPPGKILPCGRCFSDVFARHDGAFGIAQKRP